MTVNHAQMPPIGSQHLLMFVANSAKQNSSSMLLYSTSVIMVVLEKPIVFQVVHNVKSVSVIKTINFH